MNAVRSNNVSLKYQRFTSSGYKVIGFTKIEFVAKSQFLRMFSMFDIQPGLKIYPFCSNIVLQHL